MKFTSSSSPRQRETFIIDKRRASPRNSCDLFSCLSSGRRSFFAIFTCFPLAQSHVSFTLSPLITLIWNSIKSAENRAWSSTKKKSLENCETTEKREDRKWKQWRNFHAADTFHFNLVLPTIHCLSNLMTAHRLFLLICIFCRVATSSLPLLDAKQRNEKQTWAISSFSTSRSSAGTTYREYVNSENIRLLLKFLITNCCKWVTETGVGMNDKFSVSISI